MIDLGLEPADKRLFEDALAASHRIRLIVQIRDRDEVLVTELAEPRVLAGGVQVDGESEVTRSLSLTLLDPGHKLHFDAANPADAALYADNFVNVKYGVDVAGLGWVDVPVFWGPLTDFNRTGAEVTIEAQGKESLGLDPHLVTRGYTLRKGTAVNKAVREVMGRLGEQRYSLGSRLPGRLHRSRTVVPGEAPWQVCVGGGEDASGKLKPSLVSRAGGNRRLFYDGLGYLTARSAGGNPVFTFRHDAHVVSPPGYDYDVLAFRNHAVVTGGVPKHSKTHVRGEYALPAGHPLSPLSLARNGKPRYMTIFQDADSLKTRAACNARARALVTAVAYQGVSAQFEALPVPHLQEGDVVTLDMGEYQLTFALTQFTIPLTADGTMTIGFNRRLARHQRRRRRT